MRMAPLRHVRALVTATVLDRGICEPPCALMARMQISGGLDRPDDLRGHRGAGDESPSVGRGVPPRLRHCAAMGPMGRAQGLRLGRSGRYRDCRVDWYDDCDPPPRQFPSSALVISIVSTRGWFSRQSAEIARTYRALPAAMSVRSELLRKPTGRIGTNELGAGATIFW
jgi:hypothetical protein